jgi:diguanylate cyclase (GGDEF)-like protein/PAS domain S-box-containing protein
MPSPERQQQIQDLLLSLATAFIDPDLAQLDTALQQALSDMARLVSADRAYLLSYDLDTQTGTNTHEWCAPGVAPHIQRFQGVPLADYADWVGPHLRGEAICVDDVSALPTGGLKTLLQTLHLKGTLALPLMDGPTCLGCVGFDAAQAAVPYLREHVQLLGLFARLLVNVRRKQRADQTLQAQRDTLQLILDHAPIGIWLQNGQGKVAFANRAFCQAIGVSEDRFKAVDHYAQLIPPDFRAQCLASDGKALASPGNSETRERLPFADGRLHDLHVIKAVKRDAQGHPECLVGLSVDITDDLAKQRALGESEERLRMALAAAKQAWFEVDVATGHVTLSPEYPELIGHDLSAQVSNMATWKDHVHPDDREHAVAMFQRVVREGGPLSVDYRRQTATGGWKWLRSVGKVSGRDAQGNPLRVVGIHTDIHELKTHEIQLERMAHFDALTGLPNRVLLADRLHQAMVQAQRHDRTLAVLYLDLDGFKRVNDTHGHDTGDQLLKALSLRLGAALREGDTMARLGGDEFVAVLQDVPDLAACRPVLERLLAAARQPLALGDTPVTISASLGMTFFPQSEDVDGDQLLRQADQAMYQAKLLGKNRFAVFDTAQAREAQGRQQTLNRLREALAHGEFVLHFQPQVNMRTGEVVGAEALIRWQHPSKGLLGPGTFLPALAGHALAIEVGEWVLATALRTLLDWRAAGLELPVSVNVDAQQLQHPDFVPTLQALLQAHPGVRPGDLELEVVESSALDDVEQAGQAMARCAALGVGFALDDFGTGYASLTYLRRLPAGLLKIDQSFVRDMLDDPDDLALMKGVIGLANAFRRQVIAEGVETAEQATVLLAMGCDWGQGFGIARPMPGADLPAWVAGWQPPASWQRHTA